MIYLASPYSHEDKKVRELRYNQVMQYAAKLMMEGHAVYSPIVHNHPMAEIYSMPTDWKFWYRQDSDMLKRADKVLVLKLQGWMTSIGVRAETALAASLGIELEYAEYD